MLVAIFISGRINCYETDLLSCLHYLSQDSNIKIDLFCSINGERTPYCEKAEAILSPWLRVIEYEVYKFPENNYCSEGAYNVFSCFYNDRKNYKMILEYSQKNEITYDYICKFRSDILFPENCSFKFPNIEQKNILYSCIPPDEIYFYGNKNLPRLICDAFAFGSPYVMEQYCKTYDSILKDLLDTQGKHAVWFEPCLMESFLNITTSWQDNTFESDTAEKVTQAMLSSPFIIQYFECKYTLNPNRRLPRD